MEIIKCKELSFTYPNSSKKALNCVNFSAKQGELVLLIGKSAAGKSTLLKLLKKEISPAGEISGELCVNASVGYVSQNVEENIVCDRVRSELSFGLTNMGVDGDEAELLVAETASYFNLENKLDCEVSSLSGGEKQMLNLASVMIMKPSLLVLDEPTSQLDPISASRFISMIKRLHRDFSTTVIISEHNAGELFAYANSIAILDNAKMILKSNQSEVVSYLKSQLPEMLGVVPVQMRLYDNAETITECREILKNKALKPVLTDKINNDVAIKIRNVFFAYNKGEDILNGLSLDIKQGCINAVIGANGSGKTTLLKAIAGVKKYYRGNIKANGKIAMLCQNPFDLFKTDKCSLEAEFGELTDFLGISDIAQSHPYDISGGQAGRLALAKVLQTGADIILLDEPTKALDASLKIKLAEILNELCNKGKTVVIVSHDIEFVGEYAHFVSFISRGKIVACASRQRFFSSLSFYTTAVARITNGIAENIVSLPDLINAGGVDEENI